MPDQVRISNGRISIGLHIASGSLVELVDEKTGENLIKNRRDMVLSPLSVLFKAEETFAAFADGARPEIVKKDRTLIVRYSQATAARRISAQAEVRIALDETLPRVVMEACVTCDAGAELTTVRFPWLAGMWLGPDWRSNVLVTPASGGEYISNPVETLSSEPPVLEWCWQDYSWPHMLGGPCGRREGESWVRSSTIAGGCSAPFVDLFSERGGIYMALEDPAHGMQTLRIETGGKSSPGLSFGFDHPAQGRMWKSPACVIALHEGNWREAVDLYRGDRFEAPQSPAWFRESAGLVTHYDFQYQSGEIVHRFAELPELYRHTQEQGLDNIMLAGWHEGGFDRGFPCYRANTLLGGEQALRAGVKQIRQQGGHVTFYVNSRLCNTAYPEFSALIEAGAERTADGKPILEQYGSDGLTFACMSPQSQAWRKVIVKAAHYLVHEIGADGLYLDQLSAASPKRCYGSHGELDGWNRGCRALLKEVREAVGPEVMILIQGVSQSTGPLCDGMLTGSLSNLHSGGFTAFYRYLQPDQVLADMMVPRKFSAMRPEPVAQLSSRVMDRAFVEGSFAWIYDLEGDNTFRLDPPQHERLKRMLELRKVWLRRYGAGRYRDEEGICAPKAMVRRFVLADGSVLLACANESGKPCVADVQLSWFPKAETHTMEAPHEVREIRCEYQNGTARVYLPQSALSLIHFKESGGTS